MSGGRPSYAELFGRSREELLDALADGIERVHLEKQKLEKQVKAGSKRTKRTDSETEAAQGEEQGDFLYDFVRMNIDYLNQMARLGSSYSVVAGRALEKLYDRFAPREDLDGSGAPGPNASKPRSGPSRRRRT
jgi:hypothetical protein